MSDVKIAAELRTEFGKGAARRLRRAAKVPAVLYGHGTDPVHLALPGHDTMLALKTPNVLLTLDIEGRGSELALPKHVQRDPLKGFIEHVDLLLVKRGEKVTVEVAVHVTGEAAPGTLVNLDQPTVSIEAEATHLPEGIEVSVEGLPEGTQILAKDLTLARGSALAGDPEQLVVNVTAAPTAEQLEGEVEETAAEGEAAADEDAAAEGEAPAAEAASDES
ncbi:50S ribosomal protein L25/general stress protein Ctc [Jiangella ureilytica]|uniref:Large ribosomal subunit protein bL25 n=1 Tax=Jiangella ureilytica TaxID=2530374 RepID=A0A4R4RSY6_9ACTN|nr:50S ribosomal protein L25/general stress protein Ctc [Jiangella ureilytica]TDC53161.1 50S ribosomal protein L25/general stress protein Ctc [Jiangella ureilytica]